MRQRSQERGAVMELKRFKTERFRVIVNGEVERTTNWKGVEKLLQDFSDVPRYTAAERAAFFKRSARRGYVYVDADITAQAIGQLDKKWIAECVKSVKAEILKNPKLAACKSFSQLHDFCDANMLGK